MSAPSVLEYARHHRLSAPHTASDLSKYLNSVSCVQIDEDALPRLEAPPQGDLFAGLRIELSYTAARRLAELIEPSKVVGWEQVLSDNDPFPHQKLKLEMPMLRSDHEKDMKWFKRPMSLHNIIRELSEGCAVGHSETDDGAAFFDRCKNAAEAACSDIQHLRLESTATALATLSRSTHDQWMPDDLCKVYDDALTAAKKPRLERLTPLLTPNLSAEKADVLPTVPELSLEPRSEQIVALDNLMLQVERKMEETDQICTSDISNGTPTKVRDILAKATTAPKLLSEPDPTTSEQQKLQIGVDAGFSTSSLKLEVPLVHSTPPRPRVEHEPHDAIEAFISDVMQFPEEPEEDEKPPCIEGKLLQQLDTCQSRVWDVINNETPSVNDSVLRVQVPAVIDEPRSEAQRASLREILDTHGITAYSISPTNEARLNWAPFPRLLMEPDLREELEISDTRQRFLAIPDHVTQSEDLLWKEPGLRLLDSGTDSDEELTIDSELIETLGNDPPQVAGGKHAIEDAHTSTQHQPESVESSMVCSQKDDTKAKDICANSVLAVSMKPFAYNSVDISDSRSTNVIEPRPLKLRKISAGAAHAQDKSMPASEGGSPSFSASASLASFLELRGNKFKKPTFSASSIHPRHSSVVSSPGRSHDQIQCSQIPQGNPSRPLFGGSGPFSRAWEASHEAIESSQPILGRSVERVEVPSTPERFSSSETQASPTIEAITEPRIVVLDEALVSNRSLMALVDQQSEETLRSIYRDLGVSADIILNPTTCLILTNLQALKQKSLPGRKSSSSNTVEDRIRRTGDQYETIFVLVSISASAALDSAALMAEFTCFCAALQITGTNVCPIWVTTRGAASGSRSKPDPMTAWTWRLIQQHSLRTQSNMSFIDDTTVWELFLREAGVNALAAQVILGMLKREPSGEDMAMGGQADCAAGSWGLRRLVGMSAQERKTMFAELVSEKCIERLSKVLDDRM